MWFASGVMLLACSELALTSSLNIVELFGIYMGKFLRAPNSHKWFPIGPSSGLPVPVLETFPSSKRGSPIALPGLDQLGWGVVFSSFSLP